MYVQALYPRYASMYVSYILISLDSGAIARIYEPQLLPLGTYKTRPGVATQDAVVMAKHSLL